MSYISPEIYIPFAEQLATISGEIIRRHFREDIPVEVKADFSPVTLADQEVEKSLRAVILSAFPTHGIIGEEYGNTNETAEYKWMIDPIDGTKSFMIGRPIFGTLISLIRGNEPILGIIDQPILGERWTGAKGFATNFNYTPTRARRCPKLSDAILCTTSPSLFSGAALEKFEKLSKAVKYVVYGGDCYSYGLLASGFVDLVLESDLKPHDFCALSPVVNGSGGLLTDWQGKRLTLESDGNVLAAGDTGLHAEIITLLNS